MMDARSGDAPRIDELTALYRIATLSGFRGDLRSVVNEILRVVGDLVACRNAALLLYDERTDEMRAHFPEPQSDRTIPLSDCGLLRRSFVGHVAEVSNDVAADADTSRLAERLGIRQVAAAPLSVPGDTTIGVLAAFDSERGAFNDKDVRLLGILADRAALTIQNSQLLDRLERKVAELEGLQRLSRLLTSADSLEDVVSESIRVVTDSIGCQTAAVLLHDPETDSLIAEKPVHGLKDEEIDALRVSLAAPSLGGTVFRTATPLASNDAENDAWVDQRMRALMDARSLTAVPLTTGRKPIGILVAINADRGCFTDDDQRFLSVLSSQVGNVIDAIRARESERALMTELRELDRVRSEFISMLAHELRGPMTTVMGFGYTLRDAADKLDDAKKAQVIATMVRETERLSRMVTDLLDLSRMEAGTLKYELEPVEIKDFAESLVETHTSLKAEHLVDVQMPDGLPKVLADRDRLHQVFMNLLTNATRYSPEGTTITLRAAEGPDHVQISVIDQGIGIQTEDVDRIFEKFAMLPKPSWVKKGTGLGLFITKTMVEAMGGRIWVESEQGTGSTFSFTLPHAGDR